MKKMDSFSGEVPHNKQTNPQPQITFYFAECMEFISYGEFRETSTLVQKALKEAEEYLDIKCGKNSNN